MSDPRTNSQGRKDLEIFLISILILFLELVLIRWIGTEVRVFAYLGNLVLVVCFFGIGLGCYLATKPISLTRLGINLTVLVTLIANPLRQSWLEISNLSFLLGGFEDSPIYTLSKGDTGLFVVAGLLMLGLLLYLVVMIFVPTGQVLGRAIQNHPHVIRAYTVNIVGSLVGIWLFNAMSLASLPPAIWFAAAAAVLGLVVIVAWQRQWVTFILFAAAALIVWVASIDEPKTVWSPYQKLVLKPYHTDEDNRNPLQGYVLEVNGTFYQHMVNLSDEFMQSHPKLMDSETARRSRYNLPFTFKSNIQNMLIVGAGTGNNAAAALRHGVEQVDCVEIDPKIYQLGKELHPEHPYDSPRVRMIVEDARAFFKQNKGSYDAIWFGLLDSHTLGSSFNNLRLDHYVYTVESFREAKQLLAEDGIFILSFGVERMWIADRLFRVMRETFGHPPISFWEERLPSKYGVGGNLIMISGHKPVTFDQVQEKDLRQIMINKPVNVADQTRLTTDDWPYLYLEKPSMPTLHLLTIITILGTVTIAGRRVFTIQGGFDWHYFALGAAFLLLEVQTVSRATLLFGMTWVVNAIVFSAVLVMILLANLVTHRWPTLPQWVAITGLTVSVGSLALVPLNSLNGLEGVTKGIVATAFLTAPVFFGGLIFIRSFAKCDDKARALGSNLIGALVGGLLESLSFVTGIRALVLLVGLFYLIALGRRPQKE